MMNPIKNINSFVPAISKIPLNITKQKQWKFKNVIFDFQTKLSQLRCKNFCPKTEN